MRKRVLIVGLMMMALTTLGFAGIALAQDPAAAEAAVETAAEVAGPLPDIDPGAAAKSLFDGIGAKNWTLILAGGGLVLMYLLRLLLLPNLKGGALAWTSTILVGLAAMCISLLAGADILSAIGVGFTAGLAAGKAWDLIPNKVTDAMEKPIKKRQKRQS